MKIIPALALLLFTILSLEVDASQIGYGHYHHHREREFVPHVNVFQRHFLEKYLSLLSDCDIDGIRQLYDDSYLAYNEEGDILNKKRMTDSQAGFCKSPLASTTFTLIEARTPGRGVFFVQVQAKNVLFKNGPLRYSFATTVKNGKIVFEVQCANAEAYTRAIRGERNIDAVEV